MLKRLFYEEDGQGMVEYGLIIALIAIAVIVVLTQLGEGLGGIFTRVKGELDGAGDTTP
ncbi:MAG: Flp family type IVb pilin [Firmicutes bacterium]|nr:Flp family type IVb pilin [Bacillota bacterium]